MKKILVIDDSQDILDVVKYLLLKAGYAVHTHSSGLGVQDKVTECNPDLILLDVNLPGKSGIEIYKELSKTFLSPIIFFSANADKQKVLKECNASGFISKPFDISDLVHTISECVNRA